MATIENLRLELLEKAGFAVAKASYQVRGSTQDVLLSRRYHEVARLIGDDSRPGEDGVNDQIENGVAFDAFTVFRNTKPIPRSKTVILQSADLDEDPAGPAGGPAKEDEIRLQVTLVNNSVTTVRGTSDIVRRGAPKSTVSPGANA